MTEERQNDATDDAPVHVGQVVAGVYRVERLLGKGGMAAVWQATSQRTGKRVALKTLLGPAADDPHAVEMLRREAQAASRINHPNVVTIYDIVEHQGSICIVMEILEGEPLSRYLARRGCLGVEEAASLLLPAMRGVAAAHTRGVIHRDLKPKNIFICTDADGRLITTKILDFGISLVPGSTGALAAQGLPTHGTPAYMSPEHIQGLADLDGRADVYSFGVLLFEALAGQLPFAGPPSSELLMRIVNDAAPRLTSLRPDLPNRISDLVARALAKDPKDRFPSLDAFVAALEAYLPWGWQMPTASAPRVGLPGASPSEPEGPPTEAPAGGVPASPEASDTRKLFTLPRRNPGQAIPSGPKSVTPANGSAAAEPRSAAKRKQQPSWARSLAALATFGGMLLLVAWLAFPRLPVVEDLEEAAPATGADPRDRSAGKASVLDAGVMFLPPDGGG